MRSPKRIGVILSALQTEWEKYPDLRFGQLLVNLGIVVRDKDPSYIEDNITMRLLGVHPNKVLVSTQGDGTIEKLWKDSRGAVVKTHPKTRCSGEYCVIHNPSDHHMRSWPTEIRDDKRFLVERICDHGVGHPDPDSLAHFVRIGYDGLGIHGCDGCCYSGGLNADRSSQPKRSQAVTGRLDDGFKF